VSEDQQHRIRCRVDKNCCRCCAGVLIDGVCPRCRSMSMCLQSPLRTLRRPPSTPTLPVSPPPHIPSPDATDSAHPADQGS
jgi:hypothetical protein